jgi:uncharacterized protein (TIGR00255 family)
MVQSMTGYGSAQNDVFAVEIRSVNHRFIDITIKTSTYMGQHEMALRNIIKEKFHRGKFDVTISLNSYSDSQMIINRDMAKDIYRDLQNLQKELSIPGEITINTLAVYKEFLIERAPQYDINKLNDAFNGAISDIESMRMREGELIAKDLWDRIAALNKMNNEIKLIAPKEVLQMREKLTERLTSILEDKEIDTNRILQEAAIMADKIDISEETDRIENHLQQFIEILDNGNIMGRKLDFLLQEINREVNTLSYKSNDYAISKFAVEMKNEIEKIREQVQNIQ